VRTLLYFISPAYAISDLVPLFVARVHNRLRRIGVPEPAVTREMAEYSPVVYAKTASRSVLSCMNDIALYCEWVAER
jgi:hypothetical protein